ncbi:MAG: AbrB/MazE/SpoVT family DNA-binding domain-containing protein [Candidatus Paceibacterota bacterium]|jgi:transcriptional pleiotropic regulator of transition state genes
MNLKATGMTRKLDNLGRVVIPMELRKTMGLNIGDGLEISTEGETIILRKFQPGCTFCGGRHELRRLGGQNVCRHCLDDIRKEKAPEG